MASYKKFLLTALIAVFISCQENHETKVTESAKADSLLFTSLKALNMERTLAVADSLEKAGAVSAAKANFVRGRAYDEGWQMYLAEHYYRKAYEGCTKPIQDWGLYAESGYRLSTILCMRLEMEESLRIATKLTDIANKEPRFPIAFKAFLLNNIAYCQQTLHQDEESRRNYQLAYETLKKEEGKVSDVAHQSNMYNMTLDIADHCYMTGDLEDALEWVLRCEEHCRLYVEHPNALLKGENTAHVTLRKAVILNALGRKKEAEEVFRSVDLSMIKNPPGITWLGRYLMATGRYNEAADCYARLDTTYVATDRAKASFDFISERLLPRFEANLKAHRIKESLELGTSIHQAIDSVILLGRKSRALELSTIYETKKKEVDLEKTRFYSRVTIYTLAVMLVIMAVIARLLFRTYKLNKTLKIRNRELYDKIQAKLDENKKSVEELQSQKQENLSTSQKLYLRTCKLMEEQQLYIQPDLNREKLASFLGTNYKYVSEAIRECAGGITVNQFINQYRLKHAAKLLADTENTIYSVMELSGFNNRSNFNKLFREGFDLSPNEYRKAAKDKSSSMRGVAKCLIMNQLCGFIDRSNSY